MSDLTPTGPAAERPAGRSDERAAGPSARPSDALRELVAACQPIAAPGTDPEVLAVVVAFAVRPRRTPDQLRRRLRDGVLEAASAPSIARALHDLARPALGPEDLAAARTVVARWERIGCQLALVGDAGFPRRLAQGWPDLDVPVWLVRRGGAIESRPSVAIVGARRATGYGTGVAAWLARGAGAANVRIVSGGAVGIDAAAHRAALDTPGGTTVVLGCGHGVAYPRAHARPDGLFRDVLDAGGALVGELLPDEPPRPGAVRARNRLLAALADVVVVVEGGARSGALVTADAAAALGRTVLAVPGDVRAPGSRAPHRLLRDGAAPCTGPEDLLAVLGGELTPEAPGDSIGPKRAEILPDTLDAALVASWPRPLRVDELVVRSGLAVGEVLAALTRARVAGLVAEDATGVRLRRSP